MSYSAEEYARYILTKDIEAKNVDKIETYIRSILDDAFSLKTKVEQQNKEIEILEEQVDFRNSFIANVLEACNTTVTKKALVMVIKSALEHSYIEL